MLERLVVAIGHDFLHALHIFASCLHQALQILPGLGEPRTRPTPEVLFKALREILKPKAHPFERGWDIGDLLGAGAGTLGVSRKCLIPAREELYASRVPEGKTPESV